METKRKILFITQSMIPFLKDDSELAYWSRHLPQKVQENGAEMRVFLPKFGTIVERRHQLHEVIRLSGLNIVIDEIDHPLILKVASIQEGKIQVYFIDNVDYFSEKKGLLDDDRSNLPYNDERVIFFSKSALETVKKLRWSPQLIHCWGWLGSLVGFYLRKNYLDDPIFENAKIATTLFDKTAGFDGALDARMQEKAAIDGIDPSELHLLEEATFLNLNKMAIDTSDVLVQGSPNLDPELLKYIKESKKELIPYTSGDEMLSKMLQTYDTWLE